MLAILCERRSAAIDSVRRFRATSEAMRVAVAFALACACGNGPGTLPPLKKDAGPPDAAVVEVPPRPLGMPDLASYGWRKGGGHPAFRVARKAEDANDWATVAKTCEQAIAADPRHLDATWLFAAALGKLGKHDELLAPLQRAVAGDFGKWGPASLENPAFKGFLATPLGEAWRRRIEQDRPGYLAALNRSLLVTSEGDVYAYDPENPRWYRVTRSNGSTIGVFRLSPTKFAYVTRFRTKDKKITLAIGLSDLTRGKTSRGVELNTKGPLVVVAPPDGNGVLVGVGSGTPRAVWRRFDENFKLTTLPAATTKPPGPFLEVTGRTAKLHTLPVPGVTADWEKNGLASQMRIVKSNRVVSVPAPGLIDGNTVIWNADRSRLAFVAQLHDQCGAQGNNAAVFIADATTGALSELQRGTEGLAVAWVGDRRLAIAGDKGVELVDLDGSKPALLLEGADGLIVPRHRSSCTPDPDPDAPAPDTEVPESAAGETGDQKLVEPP